MALSASAALGWVALGGTARPPEKREPVLPYRAGGVTVSRVPAGGLRAGEPAEGARDDLLVQNGRLSFVVGAFRGGSPERRARYGSLVDVALKDFSADELAELKPVARAGGKWLGLGVAAVTVATEGKYPYVTVEQVSKDGLMRMHTDMRAAPGASRIELVTRFHNDGPEPLRGLELGERTRWPGAATFAPRVGFPKIASRAEIPWLARQGAKLSYAQAFPQGTVEAQFFFDRIGQLGQDTMFRMGDVPPASAVTYRRELVVVEGDLGRAAALAFQALGRKLGRVEGKLEPPPAWAVIEARFPDGKPALSVRAHPDGTYSLPLPTGDYLLVLKTPGGEDDEQVSVEAGKPPIFPKLIAPVPGRLHFSVTDADGAGTPARIILRGIPPTKDPELGPTERGGGARNVIFTRSGDGEVELPQGRYRVVVSHGPEYEIADQEIEIDRQTGVALRAELDRTVETGGWIGCDFHLHAAPSHDSNVSLDDRVLSLLAEGVRFAVATDHNHVTDYAPAVEQAGAEDMLKTAPGIEITTLTWGHFNAFPYPIGAEPPPFSGVTPGEIFATVRARAPGAAVQVNHPRMPGVGYFNRIELDPATGRADAEEASMDFDAIEVVNGYDVEAPKFVEQNLREYFALLNVGRRYAATGNSDSHRLIINWAGYPRTYVRVADDRVERVNPSDVARAVIEGRVQVSNGIFLAIAANGTAGPGDTVVGRRVTLDVEARAPSWVDVRTLEVWMNGALAARAVLPRRAKGRVQPFQTELDAKQDSWIVVVARGDEPMSAVFMGRRVLPFAFTNPIYVDADEDGVISPVESFEAPAPRAP